MRIELRVCKGCYTGVHEDHQKTEVTKDIVACAEQIREYKDAIGLQSVYITKVEDGDAGGAETLDVLVAGVEDETVTLRDTQLVVEDHEGGVLVYPELGDILTVLTRNLEQIDQQVEGDVSVDLSAESLELLA
ncbi:MAG: hypothetical protein PPP58_03490 [Natronomonas sp.]